MPKDGGCWHTACLLSLVALNGGAAAGVSHSAPGLAFDWRLEQRRKPIYRELSGGVMSLTGFAGLAGAIAGAVAGAPALAVDFCIPVDVGSGKPCG